MNTQQWNSVYGAVTSAMSAFVRPYVTPLSASPMQSQGEACGTGNYVVSKSRHYLLTCAHVARDLLPGDRLAHIPGPSRDYVAVSTTPQFATNGADAVIYEIAPRNPSLDVVKFDTAFCPAPNELLFWLGCPGTTAARHEPPSEGQVLRTYFGGNLDIPVVPVTTQAAPPPGKELLGYVEARHFLMHYPAEGLDAVSLQPRPFFNAKGMSGSLVWDTKYVAGFDSGAPWNPECARVCGVIWSHQTNPDVVVATRIEHVLSGFAL